MRPAVVKALSALRIVALVVLGVYVLSAALAGSGGDPDDGVWGSARIAD